MAEHGGGKPFKKDKPKPKPSGPWGVIIVILLLSAALSKLGFGNSGNMASSTASSTLDAASSEPPADKPAVTIGQ